MALVEAYAKAQGLWREAGMAAPLFSDTLSLDLSTVEPALAGPKRPQDRVSLSGVRASFEQAVAEIGGGTATPVEGADYSMEPGHVVIAAITSCTNTSNPSVLVAAGLVARNALERGLSVKPWVKTSLAPGSQVVTDYLEAAGLQDPLDALGFNLVGYGCTTCIGNSGPLADPIAEAVEAGDITVGAVLSGNRNFEGRVHAQVKANYLASPPLVVAYALAGTLTVDLARDPLGQDEDGNPVYLRDIWPSDREIRDTLGAALSPDMFRARYGNISEGPAEWREIRVPPDETYRWNDGSTYVRHAPYFQNMEREPQPVADVAGARVLLSLADSITTDHISPAGAIKRDGPAGDYLIGHQVRPVEFNSYGARRGNHEVMMRGTFANIRIRNELAPGTEGGVTTHRPSGEVMSVYDAAMRYREEGVPLVVFGGKEYGTGSSRDWAAKGSALLGIKAVIVESFERIHRSNLIGMGVLPLEFTGGMTRKELGLDGSERVDILGVADDLSPRGTLECRVRREDGTEQRFEVRCRIDTENELDYFRHGGILPYVLRNMLSEAA